MYGIHNMDPSRSSPLRRILGMVLDWVQAAPGPGLALNGKDVSLCLYGFKSCKLVQGGGATKRQGRGQPRGRNRNMDTGRTVSRQGKADEITFGAGVESAGEGEGEDMGEGEDESKGLQNAVGNRGSRNSSVTSNSGIGSGSGSGSVGIVAGEASGHEEGEKKQANDDHDEDWVVRQLFREVVSAVGRGREPITAKALGMSESPVVSSFLFLSFPGSSWLKGNPVSFNATGSS